MTSLADALHDCDMLLIDGLHAFDFTFDDQGLMIECMDGRERKHWHFTPEQVQAATGQGTDWRLSDAHGEHSLICMSALRAWEDDEDEPHPHDLSDGEPDEPESASERRDPAGRRLHPGHE
ncbi:DUF5629 family protein [Pseudomonas entomophila]|nr:DUF5629 family protein [Pseudomonas entomophila]